MEALRKVALAYHDSGTSKERRLFTEFFQSIDKNASGRVSYEELLDFMSQQAHDKNMRERDFFNKLDINGSGGLESKEVLTLYYILRSGRPICRRCKIFITSEYFTCMSCFEPQTAAYSVCLECFRKGSLKHDKRSLNDKHDKGSRKHKHDHDRSHFVDNFSLLEYLRKKPLPHHQPTSRSSGSCSDRAIVPYNPKKPAEGRPSSGSSGSCSDRAIVPYNPKKPAEGRGQWQVALKVFEAALPIAAMVGGCSIM